MITTLLEKAFKDASKLPEIEQNSLARWLIDEIIAEKQWEKTFAESEDMLEKLANEAISEHEAGKTRPLDLESL